MVMVNCDKTEEVGANIQKKLDNMNVVEGSLKRSEQVRSLGHLYPAIHVDKQKIHINPNNLFSRMIAIVQREEDMAPYFDFELTANPTSLFKENSMRKPVKAQFANALLKGVETLDEKEGVVHVLDGGALIHRVKWSKKRTYKDIAMQYVNYVRGRYGNCCMACIVFEGYGQSPSINDHEHQRRVRKADWLWENPVSYHHDRILHQHCLEDEAHP